MSLWWWTLTYFVTSEKVMKCFSMVGWYSRLHKWYLNQVRDFVWHFKNALTVDFLENVFAHHHSHFLSILWVFVSSTKWFYYSCIKNSWLGFLFTWTNRKKTHITNKANGVMLIYHKQSLTIKILQYLLSIIHGTYVPVNPCVSCHLYHSCFMLIVGHATFRLFLMRLLNVC